MEVLNFITLGLLNPRNPLMIIAVITLLAAGLVIPFGSILLGASKGGRGYLRIFPTPVFIGAAVFEEIVFRWYLLTFPLSAFEPLSAVLIAAVIYTIYATILYGTPGAAMGIVIGVIYGLAFLQFGLIPVVIAHILLRFILLV